MEVFLDFGLFEVLAVIGLAALSRAIYSNKITGILFLFVSVAAPVAMLTMVSARGLRWAGAVSAATALVNVAVIAAVMQEGRIPRLRFKRRWQRLESSTGEQVPIDACGSRTSDSTAPDVILNVTPSGKGRDLAR